MLQNVSHGGLIEICKTVEIVSHSTIQFMINVWMHIWEMTGGAGEASVFTSQGWDFPEDRLEHQAREDKAHRGSASLDWAGWGWRWC